MSHGRLPALANGDGGELATGGRLNGAAPVIQAMNELKTIRTFVANEMKPGLDFGVIPGTGDKPTLYLPGAQKVAMFFNTAPDYTIQATDLGGGHVEYLVTTRLVYRASGIVAASGVGSCSTMEKKYRYRSEGRKCPQCDATAIKKSKFGKGGWYCHNKAGGCGAQFPASHPGILDQPETRAENPDIHDTRNTVLKMAKKRSLVDAAMGLGCLSELFSQDIGDTFDLDDEDDPEPEPAPPPHPNNASGHGRGEYASPEQAKEYAANLRKFLDVKNAEWADRWVDRETFEPIDGVPELINPWQANAHLVKWAVDTGRLDPHILPEDLQARKRDNYPAVVYFKSKDDRRALTRELERYVEQQAAQKTEAVYRKFPHLDPDREPQPENASQEEDNAPWEDEA